MLMDDYMKQTNTSDSRAADELGCSPECVRLWRKRKRVPRPDAMLKIETWSDGRVTAADFYGPGEQTEARVCDGVGAPSPG